MKLRSANNSDFEAIFEIINAHYQKHGDRVWLEGHDSDLLDIESGYSGKDGAFVVLEDQGTIVGTHATQPVDISKGLLTFRRLYVKAAYHGRGAGKLLFDWAMDWTAENNFKRVEFWSDIRYKRAHKFFEKYGFINSGKIQHLEDAPFPYSEYKFYYDLPQKD